MDKSLNDCLIKWLRTFAEHSDITSESLSDGIAMGDILHQIAPEYFNSLWKSKILTNVGGNWRLKMSNLRKIHQGVMDYLSELPGQTISQFPRPDLNKICEHGDEIELGRLLQLILGCAINCEQKQKHIEAIMKMEEGVQAHIVNAIQDLMNRESTPGVLDGSGGPTTLSGPWFGPASFHPHMKTLVEQLESTSLAKEDMTRRCNELDLLVSVLTDEKDNLKNEKDKLLERIEILESGGDIGAQSFRYKEIRKQVDTLQDDLYKLESSRDEYRSRVEDLERENKEITAKNEELQILAEQARSLKDEVDALKDMSDRVAVYEGTVETLKKRMEELSDLKRQIKKLEEKNSEYMQINIELEEEVKKSATLRPQLDLYKKQVGDLHQKLSDEEKKTDRQVFENKKVVEKLEAVSQEKERMIVERDLLKENLEELKCTVSALGSPENASRPLSDLAGIDTLEIISPEIREKLVRLQHENRVLKQKANEKSNESAPVLQSLLNDLQERHDKLLQENRWGDKFCPPAPFSSPWPPFGRTRSPSQSLVDAYFLLDARQKLKLLKRNLKWASESDLLILRQPNKFMKSYIHSNMNAENKSLTLPPSSLVHASNNITAPHKDNPIVIRHIHEFKMPPSPTNDDSGCCRTSPSSYEGCEDHPSGSFGTHTPDYVGTLDSGISGMYRCISPVIPSIVEECTTHHMSDILPALINHESNIPPVMYHSHPMHNNCYRCCSPKAFVGDNCETSAKEKVSFHTQTLCSCMHNSNISYNTLDSNSYNPCSHNIPENCTKSNSPLNSVSQQDTLNVSQNRKQPSTYLIRTDPPNSPTPHNSPRLPHSIHSNRSKNVASQNMLNLLAKEIPSSHIGKFYVEPEKDRSLEVDKIPIKVATQVQSKLSNISGVSNGDGSFIKQARPSSMTEIPRKIELQLSQNDLIKFPDSAGARRLSVELDPHLEQDLKLTEGQRYQQHENSNSNLSVRVRSKTPDRIKSIFPERFRASFRDKNYVGKSPEKEKEGGSFRKLRSKSLDKYKAKVSSKLGLHSNLTESPTPANENRKICKVDSDVDISQNSLNCSRHTIASLLDSSNIKLASASEKYQRGLKHSVSLDHKLNGVYKLNTKPSLIQVFSDSERRHGSVNPNNTYIANSTHASLRMKNNSSPPLQIRPHSYCKFGERIEDAPPAIMNLFKNCAKYPSNKELHEDIQSKIRSQNLSFEDNVKIRKGPASLGNICNAEIRNTPNRTPIKSKSEDVTLLTDTMFTHFVVTPKQSDMFFRLNSTKNHCRPSSMLNINTLEIPLGSSKLLQRFSKGSSDLVVSDTDTDIEMIENRLVSSCYGAPLVSSESNISFFQGDQTDLEPSATDYASEIDFDPEKYKFNHNKSLLETDLDETYSYFDDTLRPLTRVDKKRVSLSTMKTKNTIGLNNKSIIKVKNKTAKTVVAETFNAMFTFCTP